VNAVVSSLLCTLSFASWSDGRLLSCFQILLSCQPPVLLSSRKVLVLEDQFTSPCPCPRTSSPCPWTTKSSKIVKDFSFCKQFVMYDHVKSINLVTATMHQDMVSYLLMSDFTYFSICYHCNPVLLYSSKVLVLALDDQFTSPCPRICQLYGAWSAVGHFHRWL